MLRITMGKGFRLKFENKVTVSVQLGIGNYCDNYNNHEAIFLGAPYNNKYSGYVESNDAEIAIWIDSNEYITKEVFKDLFNIDLCDDVASNVNADDVAKIIAYCQKRRC